MARFAFLHLLYATGAFHQALAAMVQIQQRIVTAAVGEEALFSCRLMEPKDVPQVTWQKRLGDGVKNMATYTIEHGVRVNPDFRGKVVFRDAGLQSSSIVIRNVTLRDEGCYLCLFNSFPEGAFTATTCLQVLEIHEPVLDVRESNSSEVTVVSCSATARPAPTVTLKVLQPGLDLSNSSSVSVANSNGTVTVTTSAALPHFHGDIEVACGVQLLSRHREASRMIPSSADNVYEKRASSDSGSTLAVIIIAFAVVAVVCITVAIIIWCKRKHWKRVIENMKTPQKPVKDIEQVKTPTPRQDARLRMSSVKKRSAIKKLSLQTENENQCQQQLLFSEETD
ncbi:uncharacterized protein V6R79_002906 [Siganus canaliculatus]